MLCPAPGDLGRSFSAETVPVPPGMRFVDIMMEAATCSFSTGTSSTARAPHHGSEPNRTLDRFRAIIVGHYTAGSAEVISDAYPEAMIFDGDVARLERAAVVGPAARSSTAASS